MILQPRVFTSPISELQGGKQYPLLVGISRWRGESCWREVLSIGDLEDPPPDFRQKKEEEGGCSAARVSACRPGGRRWSPVS